MIRLTPVKTTYELQEPFPDLVTVTELYTARTPPRQFRVADISEESESSPKCGNRNHSTEGKDSPTTVTCFCREIFDRHFCLRCPQVHDRLAARLQKEEEESLAKILSQNSCICIDIFGYGALCICGFSSPSMKHEARQKAAQQQVASTNSQMTASSKRPRVGTEQLGTDKINSEPDRQQQKISIDGKHPGIRTSDSPIDDPPSTEVDNARVNQLEREKSKADSSKDETEKKPPKTSKTNEPTPDPDDEPLITRIVRTYTQGAPETKNPEIVDMDRFEELGEDAQMLEASLLTAGYTVMKRRVKVKREIKQELKEENEEKNELLSTTPDFIPLVKPTSSGDPMSDPRFSPLLPSSSGEEFDNCEDDNGCI
ncbi:hypothetical protein R1sor_001316 [Riccia sorocarpa]|uniref:Uncharacterized protein n=1 Tax=Riccia sorocarpa TaxID=122646 RepID=A0ABD3GVY1_9MARC